MITARLPVVIGVAVNNKAARNKANGETTVSWAMPGARAQDLITPNCVPSKRARSRTHIGCVHVELF
jgi:hypothetical protein